MWPCFGHQLLDLYKNIFTSNYILGTENLKLISFLLTKCQVREDNNLKGSLSAGTFLPSQSSTTGESSREPSQFPQNHHKASKPVQHSRQLKNFCPVEPTDMPRDFCSGPIMFSSGLGLGCFNCRWRFKGLNTNPTYTSCRIREGLAILPTY